MRFVFLTKNSYLSFIQQNSEVSMKNIYLFRQTPHDLEEAAL